MDLSRFRDFVKLYVLIVVVYCGASYVIPDLVSLAARHIFLEYNQGYSKGMLSLVSRQFQAQPESQWASVAASLNRDFAPLSVSLLSPTSSAVAADELAALEAGHDVYRMTEWGLMASVIRPLNERHAIEIDVPAHPFGVVFAYKFMHVLIIASLLGFLLLWIRPHWRDLEKLKHAAHKFGEGVLDQRTTISPGSGLADVATTFDKMADQIQQLIVQQRDLINAVSHELRTPLARLEFGIALILTLELPEAARERTHALTTHIRVLEDLVNELLSYTRMGAAKVTAMEVGLEQYLDSVISPFYEDAERVCVQLDVICTGLPERFFLEPKHTAWAIQNFVKNALRYAQERVVVTFCNDSPGVLGVSVEDDGIGIPVEEAERVFEPFYRLDQSRARATGGFGLGLAIARRAIEGQGGTIALNRSALGGAQFTVTLTNRPPTLEFNLGATSL